MKATTSDIDAADRAAVGRAYAEWRDVHGDEPRGWRDCWPYAVPALAVLAGLLVAAGVALAHHDHGPAPAPRPWVSCALTLADADSSPRAPGDCPAWRLPDVDACETSTAAGRAARDAARAAFEGRRAMIDVTAPRDRYGRLVTSPRFADGSDLRTVALARGWVVERRWRDGWIDPAPICPAGWAGPADMPCDDAWRTSPCDTR